MGRFEGTRNLTQDSKPSLCSLSLTESIIHSDPELSLKDNYFMTQNERYEAAIKKKFHIQMLAQRLGWSEDSHELYYANRCSHPGQPHQRGIHLGPPRKPSP